METADVKKSGVSNKKHIYYKITSFLNYQILFSAPQQPPAQFPISLFELYADFYN